MRPNGESQVPGENKIGAQEAADRIRILREELATGQVQAVLALTPDQRARFDEWSRTALAALAQQFDVDTTSSQKRVSWGMRIASTLGGLAMLKACENRTFYAPDVEPTIEDGLPVLSVVGLTTFNLPHPMLKKAAPEAGCASGVRTMPPSPDRSEIR